jgi:hypothetical protein
VEPVLISRRDGEDLVLMSYKTFQQENQFLELVGRFMNALDESDEVSIGKRLAKDMPWLRILNSEQLGYFVAEMIEQITVATSTGVYRDALIMFDNWQAKARAIQMGLDTE